MCHVPPKLIDSLAHGTALAGALQCYVGFEQERSNRSVSLHSMASKRLLCHFHTWPKARQDPSHLLVKVAQLETTLPGAYAVYFLARTLK